MGNVKKALGYQSEAKRKRLLAPKNDHVRLHFDQMMANSLEEDAQLLLTPEKPLELGLGGEIIPPESMGAFGLESILREPDLVNLGASSQRMELLDKAGVLELGVETSHLLSAKGPIQQMLCHQLAALHKCSLDYLAESSRTKDPDVSSKRALTAAKLMDTFSRSSIVLQRLQEQSPVERVLIEKSIALKKH